MTDWISGSLDDLCEVEYGTRVTRKRDGGTMYPVYGGGGATFNLDDFNRQDQMIISRFAMSEECVRFVPGKFFLNDSGLTVRTRDASLMLQEFLDQQLLAKSSEIYLTARGTAQKNMDMTMFRGMDLTFPDSLEEQKRIVALLDAANKRVTELTACYEQARTHANSLFASALGDALEGNADSPVKNLGNLFDFQNGRGFKKTEWAKSGLPIIRIQNLNSESAPYNYFTGTFDQRILVEDGDLLFSWSGSIGTSFGPHIWQRSAGLLNQHIFKVIPKVPIDTSYAHYCLRLITAAIERSVNGAVGLVHITKEKLTKFEIPVPPLEEQKRIVDRLDLMRAKTSEMVAAYDAKLTAAKNLRQSILEAAFGGDL
jgi:type I restriction enzyme S subunit